MTTTHPASPAAVSTVLTRLRALTKARDFEAARDVETSILRTLVTAAAHGEDIIEAAQVWYEAEGDRWYSDQDETRADYIYRSSLEEQEAAERDHEIWSALHLARPVDSTHEERVAAAMGYEGW